MQSCSGQWERGGGMWRRALLAAAAVTALSYLICVLIMSGLQKEDLDVSMLGKLQRYDVNFDDINNEQMRRQCSLRNDGFTKGDQKQFNEVYVSTTEYTSTIRTNDPLPSVTLNMDNFLNYLKVRENSFSNLGEITTSTSMSIDQEIVTRGAEFFENKPIIDTDFLSRYIQLETQKKSLYKINNESDTTEHGTIINLKNNQRNTSTANDAKLIEKLMQYYLFKKQKMSTTTEYSTTRFTIDIQNVYKQIDEIISNASSAENKKDKIVISYPKTSGEIKTKHNVISSVQGTPLSQNRPDPTGTRLFESFYNFLSEMNQFRNNSSRPSPIYDDNVHSKDKPQPDKSLEPFNKNEQVNNKESTTYKLKSVKEPDQKALTTTLAKEIAETVKKVIIKDLRNELAGIYLKTTQTTTKIIPTSIKTTAETFPTTTSRSTIQEKDMAIMDKFMDLYEQIKSLKQATFLLRANGSATLVNNLKQPKKIAVSSAIIMPTINRSQSPEPKISIYSVDNYNTKPLYNYNSYLPRKENNRLPITIQTNSVEIQPLAVPLTKPESMIRQNIVVHTGHHYQGTDNHRIRHSSLRGKSSDSNMPIKHKSRTYKKKHSPHYDVYNSARYPHNILREPKQREDVIRFTMRDNGNLKLDTDYYEKINFGNDHDIVTEKHAVYNNRIPRFHERLERIEPGSEGMPVVPDVDNINKEGRSVDFPSRHQLSLVEMKKGTSYDDTHFKNFLKTQQKVTDILERILATGPKTNTPRSVETV